MFRLTASNGFVIAHGHIEAALVIGRRPFAHLQGDALRKFDATLEDFRTYADSPRKSGVVRADSGLSPGRPGKTNALWAPICLARSRISTQRGDRGTR